MATNHTVRSAEVRGVEVVSSFYASRKSAASVARSAAGGQSAFARRFLAVVGTLLALALSSSASIAGAGIQGNTQPGPQFAGPFDLAINIISPTPAAVNSYLASLPAATRNAILSGCTNYTVDPQSARSIQTSQFCSTATAGNLFQASLSSIKH